MDTLLDRFLRYIKIDTQSTAGSTTHPSTPGQLELARLLEKELTDLGLTNITLSAQGYLMAELPANTGKKVPTVGFLAHLDTSPDVSGRGVKPLLFPDYDGGDLVINQDEDLFLRVRDYPELKEYTGQTIITTDGRTLLGADDKAGIAAIMNALSIIKAMPDFEHVR
jgi:tripeptide aminopeptidase